MATQYTILLGAPASPTTTVALSAPVPVPAIPHAPYVTPLGTGDINPYTIRLQPLGQAATGPSGHVYLSKPIFRFPFIPPTHRRFAVAQAAAGPSGHVYLSKPIFRFPFIPPTHRRFAVAQAAAVVHPLALTATQGQGSAAIHLKLAIEVLAATNVNAAAASTPKLLHKAYAATDAQTAASPHAATLYRSYTATSAEVASAIHLATHIKALTATDAETAVFSTTKTRVSVLNATDAEATSTIKTAGTILRATGSQAFNIVRTMGVIRASTDAQVAAETSTKMRVKALAATSAMSVLVLKAVRTILSATNAQTAAASKQLVLGRSYSTTSANVAAESSTTQRVKVLAITGAQAFDIRRFMSKALAATSPETVSVSRLMAYLRSFAATDAESASLSKSILLNKTLATTDAQVSGFARQPSLGRSYAATSVNVAAIARATSKSISVTSAQATTAARSIIHFIAATSAQSVIALKAVGKTLTVTSTESLGFARQPALGRSYGTTSANVAHITQVAIGKSVSATSAQVAHITQKIVHFVSMSGTQSALAIKTVGKPFSVAATQVLGFARQPSLGRSYGATSTSVAHITQAAIGKSISVSTVQAFNIVRKITHFVSASTGQSVAALRNIKSILAATSANLADAIVRRAQLVSLTASQGQTASYARIVRYAESFVTATSQVTRSIKGVQAIRGAVNPYASSLARGTQKITGALSDQVTAVARAFGRVYGAVQTSVVSAKASTFSVYFVILGAQTVQSILAVAGQALLRVISVATPSVADAHGNPGKVFGAESPSEQEARKQAAITRTVAQLQAASQIHWFHEYLPASERTRIVTLPEMYHTVTLPRAVLDVVLPDTGGGTCTLPALVTRVLLPTEEEEMSGFYDPEPHHFSAMDPTDENIVTFDWSRRAYPNDRIIFASVVSDPPGVNFLGPAFIDGLLVDITVGPTTPPQMPATYGLRCTAVFHSGRTSNFTIPIEIKPL